jgi:hypothetical protein
VPFRADLLAPPDLSPRSLTLLVALACSLFGFPKNGFLIFLAAYAAEYIDEDIDGIEIEESVRKCLSVRNLGTANSMRNLSIGPLQKNTNSVG